MIVKFVSEQTDQIRKGGLPIFLRKLYIIPLILLAIPVILLVRALRPLIIIRFGKLISTRIGHFAGNTEVYLCERDAGLHGRRILDIFYYSRTICNYQLKKMWDRSLITLPFAAQLDRVNRLLPGGSKHIIPLDNGARDVYGLLERTPTHLSFTTEEEKLGYTTLQEFGISNGAPFICFHTRSAAYLNKEYPDIDWGYHNFRDSDIKTFFPAAEELGRRGYFVVRTGSNAEKRLKTANPMIIDYAIKDRTEFLDIFLGAKCLFYLGDSCGFNAIPMIFRRAGAIANMIPLEHAPTWASNYLFIPKKLWLRKERRFMSFREILNSGAGRFLEKREYNRLGIEVIENSPEEITALAIEMDERLKGRWQTTKEDEELQRRFWSHFKPSELNQVFLSHIGAEFLRQNCKMLE